jgi:hypothetical protein
MLTSEAAEERRWNGLRQLRRILAEEEREYRSGLRLTSVDDDQFERMRRTVYLASLVVERPIALRTAIADARELVDDQRLSEIIAEVRQLHTEVKYACHNIAQLDGRLEEILWERPG